MKILNAQAGVTMIELLVVVAIVGIFATIGIPSMTDMVRNNRVSSARMNFISDLNMARGEAIKRNMRVLVCSGQGACSNNANWAGSGWIICYDGNRDDVCDAPTATNPNPIIERAPLHTDIALNGPTVPVAYNSIGSAAAAVDFTLQGTWSGAATMPAINIALTGFTTTK